MSSWQKFFSKFSTSADGKFSLPLPLVAGLTLILVCAVAWAFFMGYMVGKGQNPEASIQEITGLSTQSKDSAASEAEPASPEIAENDTPPLSLGETGTLPVTAGTAAPFVRPQGEETAAWDNAPAKAQKSAPVVQPAKGGSAGQKTDKKPAVRNSEPQFEYNYQLAAFKSSQDAKNLVARLGKSGIRAQSGKSGKVTLVTCTIRGTQADANDLRKKVASLKLGQPLLLSKKPVSGKGKRK